MKVNGFGFAPSKKSGSDPSENPESGSGFYLSLHLTQNIEKRTKYNAALGLKVTKKEGFDTESAK